MTGAATVSITARAENWPLAQPFVIARGTKLAAEVVVVTARLGGAVGRGEAVPYAHYGETVDGVLVAIERAAVAIAAASGETPLQLRQTLSRNLAAGAARNAIDCALWDLDAKLLAITAAELAGCPTPVRCLTAFTLSLGSPDAMAAAASAASHLPLLKLKLGGVGDADRMRAVRASRPDARLIADANEAWTVEQLPELLAVAAETGMETVEQPLPARDDAALAVRRRGVAICADESVHTRADLARLGGLYDAVNIKLDKAGGLTEALAMAIEARARGLRIMVGCMVGTSLAMAPALLLAGAAEWVDLDGPLLLARDRDDGLAITGGWISPARRELWG